MMSDIKAVSLYLNNKTLAIRMPLELWRQLKTYCFEHQETITGLIRKLLEDKFKTSNEEELWKAIWQAKIQNDQSINSITVNLITKLLAQ